MRQWLSLCVAEPAGRTIEHFLSHRVILSVDAASCSRRRDRLGWRQRNWCSSALLFFVVFLADPFFSFLRHYNSLVERMSEGRKCSLPSLAWPLAAAICTSGGASADNRDLHGHDRDDACSASVHLLSGQNNKLPPFGAGVCVIEINHEAILYLQKLKFSPQKERLSHR